MPELDAVASTLYSPLYARAHAVEYAPRAGFADPVAVELLARSGATAPKMLTGRTDVAGAVWRAALIDGLTGRFCRRNPHGTVVSAGIGLCTRRQRLAGSVPDTVTWVGIDVAAVVELRRDELPEDPTTLVATSVGEPTWADQVPVGGTPVLVIAEGVLMYLERDEVTAFFAAARRFGPGTEVLADYFHPHVALGGRHPITKTGVTFRSGARNGKTLPGDDTGWTLKAEHDVMGRLSPAYRAAATAFRLATAGGRAYSISHLVTS